MPLPSTHSAAHAHGFGCENIAPFSLTPGYTLVINPISSSGTVYDGAFNIIPYGVAKYSFTLSIALMPFSSDAAPDNTAQAFDSKWTLPSLSVLVPIFFPFLVIPLINQSLSHNSLLHTSFT